MSSFLGYFNLTKNQNKLPTVAKMAQFGHPVLELNAVL
jgi:hypothetical protein